MSNDTFTFFCPACGAKLTLALRLAGVVGPCPSCRSQIQAPTIEALMQHAQATGHNPIQSPAAPVPAPQPPVQEPVQPPPAAVPPRNPYFIEPRQLPQRSEPVEIVSRPISDETDRPREGSYAPPPRRRHSGAFRRALVPFVFLGATVALVAGLIFLLTSPGLLSPAKPPPEKAPSPVKKILTDDPAPTDKPATDQAAVTPPAKTEPTPPVALVSPEDRGNRAMKTLETFLKANSLEERQPIIETSATPEELQKSCLNGKLPESRFDTLIQESNDLEKVVDCYYSVHFRSEDTTEIVQTMLVRIRGDAPPKVVVDPFLDLYGGRLKEFMASTGKDSGKFQVVLTAMRYSPAGVPSPESKGSIKLQSDSASPGVIGSAVFGVNGPIGKILDDPSSGMHWGAPKYCTVVLQWNRDDPNKPYVEALDITRLDWNP